MNIGRIYWFARRKLGGAFAELLEVKIVFFWVRALFCKRGRLIDRAKRIVLVVFCAMMTLSASAQDEHYVSCRNGARPAPVVIVTNVCPWPNLTVLPNGEIAAIIFNQPSHGRMPGELDCWVTADHGRTWQRRTSPVLHEQGTLKNYMNQAVGLANNGDLMVISSGWTLIEKEVPIHNSKMDVDKLLDPVVCRSSDGGRTWSVVENALPAESSSGGKFIPHGDIVIDSTKALRVAAYTLHPETKLLRVYVLESLDDGKTWGNPVAIDANKKLGETFILRTGGDRWLAAARGKQVELYESTSPCREWQCVGPVSEVNEVPGHLLKLRDGRLLLSAGRRVDGDEGVIVKISEDDGKTWSKSATVVDFIGFDGGYPSSVELPDGRILTAYYAKKTDYYDGYHMGQVIWCPTATFPKK